MRAACVVATLGVLAARAHAQERYETPATGALSHPTVPIAGEHDARALAVNPAGLALVAGSELVVAGTIVDDDRGSGAGVGAYLTGLAGGGLLPRLGWGLGVEWLRPERGALTPDPGNPTRLSVGLAQRLGRRGAIGLAWRHLFDAGRADGVDTFDLGWSWRVANRLAIAGGILDLGAPVAGGEIAPRRHQLELAVRPTGTDRLDLGMGARLAEDDGALDAWARLTTRVARGVFVHVGVESRALTAIDAMDVTRERRDLRASLGLELSFGALGAAAYVTAARDPDGRGSVDGATFAVRATAVPTPSILTPAPRIERLELTGALDARGAAAVVARLRAIEADGAVVALVATIDGLAAGWATLDELRVGLARVRASGKRVFAYTVGGTSRDYFVATAADQIYVDPAGGLRLTGFAASALYWKDALAKVGASGQFEKIAEYKSAPEAFTEAGATADAARARDALYDDLDAMFLGAIASGRGLELDTARQLVDAGPYSAGALEREPRLVDAVADPDQVADKVTTALGGVFAVGEAAPTRGDRWRLPAIAVIYAEGDIVDGASRTIPLVGRKVAGGQTISAAIAAARADPEIGAIVLRIDSAGGSALASDLMSREVFKTRGVKPILCSLGDLAASGGYFLAAGCDVIFADPMTITGSIGIFTGKIEVSALLARMGVGVETTRRGARADMDSLLRPYTDDERAALRDSIRYFYDRFVGAVARGRNLTVAQVDAVARGRVWTGRQAQSHGLVDRMGGLGDALEEARRRMGVPDGERVQTLALPAVRAGLLDAVLGGARGGNDGPDLGLAALPAVRALLDALPASVLADPWVPQARLPYELRFD